MRGQNFRALRRNRHHLLVMDRRLAVCRYHGPSIRFVLDAYYELRHKVTWPSFNEARNMTIAVLLLSAAVGAVLGAADFGLQHLYFLLIHAAGK